MSVLLSTLNSNILAIGDCISSPQIWLLEILYIFVHTSCSLHQKVASVSPSLKSILAFSLALDNGRSNVLGSEPRP